MGTRADFYVGRGTDAEWLGSIAWDGNPGGAPAACFEAIFSEADWRKAVSLLLSEDDSATLPEQGWPWPWDDSGTTDYAHAYDDGKLYSSSFGHPWFVVDPLADNYGEPDGEAEAEGPAAVFPDMAARQNVTFGKRSGAIIVSGH